MRITSCGLTDVGLKRAHNEDSFINMNDLGLFVVADGMGGHAAGEVASQTAIMAIVDFVRDFLDPSHETWPFGRKTEKGLPGNTLEAAIRTANLAVCNKAKENHEYTGMGTTIASLLIIEQQAAIAHVGDSRVYRSRGPRFDLLTMDHSWVNEQLAKNIITEDEARNHRWRNVITRALGNKAELDIGMAEVDMAPGDIFLLCSDGLSGMVDDEETARIIRENQNNLRSACDELVAAANCGGGIDNITVLLVRLDDDDAPLRDDERPRDHDAPTQRF